MSVPAFWTDLNLAVLLNQLSDGVVIIDRERRIRHFNEAAQALSGYAHDELIDRLYHERPLTYVGNNGNPLAEAQQPLGLTSRGETCFYPTLYLRHQNGWPIAIWLRAIPLLDANGQVVGMAEIFNRTKDDGAGKITALAKLAFSDPVTQLFNRPYLEVKLRSALDEMTNTLIPCSLVMVSITNLKQINDQCGAEMGDKLLKLTAKALLANSEPDELICRWQGAKLVILLQQPKRSLLLLVANKKKILLDQLSVSLNGMRVHAEVALSATMIHPGDTLPGIIERADLLLRQSEQSGNRIAIEAE